MAIIHSLILRLIHAIYALYLFALSFRQARTWSPPQPLKSSRLRTPKHLALVLKTSISHSKQSTRTAIVQSVANVAEWCRELGIQKLTVYEEHGLLDEYDSDIRSELIESNRGFAVDSDSSESEIEYQPLPTPPPSDYSDSRPISPSQSSRPIIPSTTVVLSESRSEKEWSSMKFGLRRRLPLEEEVTTFPALEISLISKDASKSAIAAAASTMAKEHKSHRRKNSKSRKPFILTVNELESLLEGAQGLSSPDFMIVHCFDARNARRNVPLEFYSFPPWHIRLTEIYLSKLTHLKTLSDSATVLEQPHPLDEISFCEALDEYAGAEFRFGK